MRRKNVRFAIENSFEEEEYDSNPDREDDSPAERLSEEVE